MKIFSDALQFRRSRAFVSGIDTTFLFFICAWSIFNSHLEYMYPYPWLAADGLLANSLFFILSGFGIQYSLMQRPVPFGDYFRRRAVRLYPPLFIVVAAAASAGFVSFPADAADAFHLFIWPTSYTYICNIAPFYILLYFINIIGVRLLMLSICVAAVLFLIGYLPSLSGSPTERLGLGQLPWQIHWSFYWIATASGAILAWLHVSSHEYPSRILTLLLLLGAYLGLKFWLVVGGGIVALYPVLYGLCLWICILAVRTLCRPEFVSSVLGIKFLGAFCSFSALLTLEIYLVHQPLLQMPALRLIAFPLNIAVLAALTIAGSILLRLVVDLLTSLLRDRPMLAGR